MEVQIGKSLKGYTVVVGFPGIGLVGPIVGRQIVDSKKMKLIGYVSSPNFPAVATIINGISVPTVRIYADETSKVAVILSEVMLGEPAAKELGRELVRAMKEEGAEMIISIAGVLMPGNATEEIFGVSNAESGLEIMQKHGISPVKKGITTGISAVMLEEGRKVNIPVLLLLGPLHAKEDYKAAAEIIQKLDEMLGLDIPYSDLLERAREIEQDVARIARQTAPENPMYG